MPDRRSLVLSVLTLALILVPFFLFGEQIERATLRFVESPPAWWATASVLTGILALDVVLPVPSSLVSTAAGALLGFWGGLVASWTGMSAGCLLGYWLGTRVPRRFSGMDRVRAARDRYGDWVLVLSRAVPVLAEASVLFAGFTRMPRARFFWITALSNLGISLAYVGAAAYSARQESFLLAFAGAIVVPAVGLALTWRRLS